MSNAIKYRHTDVPRNPGERARLKVVQGPDFGSIYVITGTRASIGRGEENDIILTDLKSSRFHAVMLQDPSGNWRIKDHNSANGILFNLEPTREAELKFNDVVTIGETSLEFVSKEAGTATLMAPPRSSAEIQAEHRTFQEARNRLSQNFGHYTGGAQAGLGSSVPLGGINNKKLLIYIVGALGLGLLFLGDPAKPPKTKSKAQAEGSVRDLASFLPTPDYNKAAETLFKDGLREYFAHNYGRARTQFETVLQISPGHVLATLYLENCNQAVDEEVKVHLEGGKKSFEAGKFREAKGHFETVMRLLYRDQTNPSYVEARDQVDKVAKASKGEGGKT